MEVVVKPLWASEPPRSVAPGSLLRVERGVARRAMVIDGEVLLAEAAWRDDVVHLRGDERAVERLRFMLALDDDLAPFHRAFRGDPLLGRVMRGRPKLRVLRVPDPFEALAWGVMFQLIDTAKAGQIAWAFTRAHGSRHESGLWAAPPRAAFENQAALEAAGLAPTQARTLARVARVGVERAATVRGIGEWTLAQLQLFGEGPLRRGVGEGRRHPQRLRAHGRRAHRQRARGRVPGGARPLRAVAGAGGDVHGRGGVAQRRAV